MPATELRPAGTHPDLAALLRPASVALVGATDRSNWTVHTLANLRRWSPGVRVQLVHPTRPTVLGLPTVPSLSALAEPVDLAYVMAPRETVPDIITEAGACGIGGAVVLTAGFGETADGQQWQHRLVAAAAQSGVAVLGPNGSGFVDVRRSITPFGLALPNLPDPGPAAFVLQSGGLIKPVLALARSWGIGMDSIIGTGNEAALSATDIVRHLLDRDEVGAIGMFLEGFRDPQAFRLLAAEALRRDRPLVVLPVGRSDAGRQGALSHTGSLAGDAAVTSAALAAMGVVEVSTLEDLVATTGLLSVGTRPRGPRLAVVGASGGAGELIADAAADHGLALPPFDQEVADTLRTLLPSFSTVANPLDVTGYATVDPQLPVRVVAAIAGQDHADVVLFQAFVTPPDDPPDPQASHAHFTAVADQIRRLPVPVLLQDEVTVGLGDFARGLFGELGLVRLPGVAVGLTSVGHTVRYVARRTALLSRSVSAPATDLAVPDDLSTEPAVLAGLAAHGVPVVPHRLVTDPQQAVLAAAELGGRVVLKVVSPDIAHKTEVGGVRLDVEIDDVAAGFQQITKDVRRHRPDARIDGVLVAPHRPAGLELVVGLSRDPVWGPVLMIGLGGVLVEVLRDVALHPLPLSAGDVGGLLDRLRGAALLDGFRGGPAADRTAIAQALLALTNAAHAWGDCWESIEINPLRVDGSVVEALDALVVPSATHLSRSHP